LPVTLRFLNSFEPRLLVQIVRILFRPGQLTAQAVEIVFMLADYLLHRRIIAVEKKIFKLLLILQKYFFLSL
jgi:hypothetical protein